MSNEMTTSPPHSMSVFAYEFCMRVWVCQKEGEREESEGAHMYVGIDIVFVTLH